jgi:hypothetical protein
VADNYSCNCTHNRRTFAFSAGCISQFTLLNTTMLLLTITEEKVFPEAIVYGFAQPCLHLERNLDYLHSSSYLQRNWNSLSLASKTSAQDIRQALAQERKLTFRTKQQLRDNWEWKKEQYWATQYNCWKPARKSFGKPELMSGMLIQIDLQNVKKIAGDVINAYIPQCATDWKPIL